MWRRSRKTDRRAGFSLTELLVTLAGLTIILTVSAQLLFETRRAAVRQQFQVEARQLARAAVDYVHFMVRGATDLNYSGDVPFPAAILTQVGVRPNQTRQVSYNNVTDANLGDLGTDIITIGRAEDSLTSEPVGWSDFDSSAGSATWQFGWACPDIAANLDAFKRLTGDNGVTSRWLLVADETGGWRFYQINSYGTADCPGLTGTVVAGSANPQANGYLQPMDATLAPLANNPRLRLGVGWVTLRVRGGWLEQKNEIFDPATDNPGTAFVQLLPNVEDLQVAYLFRDGSLWNNAPGHTLAAGIPTQGSFGIATDAANVLGLRVTVTVRAPEAAPGESRDRFGPLAAEDHVPTAGPDRFYRYQTSGIVLLRNRSRTR
jgi:type II secretory pathway component PulJ